MSPAELRVLVAIVAAAVAAMLVVWLTAQPAAAPFGRLRPAELAPVLHVTISPSAGCPAQAKSNGVEAKEQAVAR